MPQTQPAAIALLLFLACALLAGQAHAEGLAPAPTPTPAPAPSPADAAPPGSPAPLQPASPSPPAGITAAEVALHSSASSCWYIVDSKVFDMTTYAPMHPAASELVYAWCGQDATQAFHDAHPVGSREDAEQSQYYIGELAA
ncbi:hypothetical protein ABPG75_007290 [Micractinium tetrahymenae]